MLYLRPRLCLTLILSIFIALLAVANAGVTVVGSGTRNFTLAPGEPFSDQLVVQNTGSTATSFTLYHTDYLFTADGSNHFGAPGSHPRSNAGWFEVVGSQRYELPAGGQVTVEIRGAVPSDPSLHGSYWSTLMVEEGQPTAVHGSDGAAPVGAGIRIVQRRAIQIITELGGGASDLRFEQPKIATDETTGHLRLQLEVHNVGTALSRADGRLEVLDGNGSVVLVADGRRSLIYPDTSVTWIFDMERLAPGLYDALVLADGGGLDVFGVRYGLDLRDGD